MALAAFGGPFALVSRESPRGGCVQPGTAIMLWLKVRARSGIDKEQSWNGTRR